MKYREADMKVVRFTLIVLIIDAFSFILNAQPKVGDRVPMLTIQEWLKGEPIVEFSDNKIYVVEFGGSWCPPCRKAIPHLTKLSKEYAGKVTVTSVFLENNNREDSADLSYIRKVYYLVQELADKIDFAIAVDVPQQITKTTWGIVGIPISFVIKSGKIIWKGNPMDLDSVVMQITEGRFDPILAEDEEENYRKALNGILKLKMDGNYLHALHGIDSLIKIYPYKTDLYFKKFGLLAGDDDEKAYSWLNWILDKRVEGFDWPHFVGGEFRKILPENRNYEIELKAIDRAIEESETKQLAAYPLSLKAYTYFEMKKYQKAIETCTQAIEYSKAPGGNRQETNRYVEALVIFKYYALASEDSKEASRWLRNEILNKDLQINSKLINGVMAFPKPDYDLGLELVNKALQNESNNNRTAYYFGKKASILASIGLYSEAIVVCKQAIEEFDKKGLLNKVAEFKRCIGDYREKQDFKP